MPEDTAATPINPKADVSAVPLARLVDPATAQPELERLARMVTTESMWTSDPYAVERLAARIATECAGVVDLAQLLCLDPAGSKDQRLFLATIALTGLRRKRRYSIGRVLVDELKAGFPDSPLFDFLEALSLEGGSPEELRKGLTMCQTAAPLLPGHAGVRHAIGSFTADIADAGGAVTPDELRAGLAAVTEAIRMYGVRAKFHYTCGRLHRYLWDFDKARTELLVAIDTEDRNASDAESRLVQYDVELRLLEADRALRRLQTEAEAAVRLLEERTSAQLVSSQNELSTQLEALRVEIGNAERAAAHAVTNANDAAESVKEAERSVRDSQIRVIEVIAFFGAILALIQVGVTQARSDTDLGTALWITGFTGGMLILAAVAGIAMLERALRPKESAAAETKAGTKAQTG